MSLLTLFCSSFCLLSLHPFSPSLPFNLFLSVSASIFCPVTFCFFSVLSLFLSIFIFYIPRVCLALLPPLPGFAGLTGSHDLGDLGDQMLLGNDLLSVTFPPPPLLIQTQLTSSRISLGFTGNTASVISHLIFLASLLTPLPHSSTTHLLLSSWGIWAESLLCGYWTRDPPHTQTSTKLLPPTPHPFPTKTSFNDPEHKIPEMIHI